ncbi:MAG: DUF3307 domain-containing protein [Chitinophagaceae bacterium]
MISPFSSEEISLLVRLLIAHCVTDFLLQSEKSVKNKRKKLLRSPSLYKHIGLTFLVAWLFAGRLNLWTMIAIIALTHLVIDAAKLWADKRTNERRYPQKDIWLFSIDQLLHVIVIVWVWLAIVKGYDRMEMVLAALLPDYKWLLKVLGYMVLTGPVTYMIRFLTKRWADNLDTRMGLQDAGKWIGILERILILTLVFIEQFTAIGFLVAAKSILRLIDKSEMTAHSPEAGQEQSFNARKHTEYVLIGTFLSFGFAGITGLIINWILKVDAG